MELDCMVHCNVSAIRYCDFVVAVSSYLTEEMLAQLSFSSDDSSTDSDKHQDNASEDVVTWKSMDSPDTTSTSTALTVQLPATSSTKSESAPTVLDLSPRSPQYTTVIAPQPVTEQGFLQSYVSRTTSMLFGDSSSSNNTTKNSAKQSAVVVGIKESSIFNQLWRTEPTDPTFENTDKSRLIVEPITTATTATTTCYSDATLNESENFFSADDASVTDDVDVAKVEQSLNAVSRFDKQHLVENLYYQYASPVIANYRLIVRSSRFIMQLLQVWQQRREQPTFIRDGMDYNEAVDSLNDALLHHHLHLESDSSNTDNTDNDAAHPVDHDAIPCALADEKAAIIEELVSSSSIVDLIGVFKRRFAQCSGLLTVQLAQLLSAYKKAMRLIRKHLRRQYRQNVRLFWRRQMLVHTKRFYNSSMLFATSVFFSCPGY